ncbi:MAG: hypothetical protein HOE90_15665 [Bacteriovoracaceae bacterium]|jgi:hypothetical protein|nr:hypothetical protein [Bacteriovoracaceae bacterium]
MKFLTFAILLGLSTSAFAIEKSGVCTVHMADEGIVLASKTAEQYEVTEERTLMSLLNEYCLDEKGKLEPVLYHYTGTDYYFMDTQR